MDKVISLFNFKNGVGKTTIAHNLSKYLECDVFEVEEDYLSLLENARKTDDYIPKNIVVNQNTIIENGIYDINSNYNLQIVKHIIKNSDYILIPTYNDYKDLIKTAASIKLIQKYRKTNIIVIFNRLDFTNKISEEKFTKKSEQYLSSICEEIKFLYIRNNRAWYKQSHNDKFFLNSSLYDEYTKKGFNKDNCILNDFTNNEILEIIYQYLYYYGPVYKKLALLRNKNPKFDNVLKEREIEALRKDFKKVDGTEMVSDNQKLYNFLTESEEVQEYIRREKKFEYGKNTNLLSCIDEAYEQIVIDLKKEKDNYDKLKTAINHLVLKEDIIHVGLSIHINLKELLRHRKVIRDFRNLLIEIDEYNWD